MSIGYSMAEKLQGKRKRNSLRFEQNEILLILRALQIHPKDFDSILCTVEENCTQLSPDIQSFFKNEDKRKKMQRIREKIHRLINEKLENIEDAEIRVEVQNIMEFEKRLVQSTSQKTAKPSKTKPPEQVANDENPSCSHTTVHSSTDEEDVRFKWNRKIARSIERVPKKKKGKKLKKVKRERSAREYYKENEKMKNVLLKEMMKERGLDSSSSSSSSRGTDSSESDSD